MSSEAVSSQAASRDEFAELHDELRAVARDVLGKTSPRNGSGKALVQADWSVLAESGWLGLEIPEAFDGAGATFAEAAVVVEEMGRAATLSSYLGSAVLGVGALAAVEANPVRDELFQAVAGGSVRLAVALATGDDQSTRFRLDAGPDPGGLRLRGQADFVPDAVEADRLLLVADDPDGVPVVVLVEPGRAGPGVSVDAQPVLDVSRSFGIVSATGTAATGTAAVGAVVSPEAVWRFRGDPAAAVRRLTDRGALAVACDSLGVAEAMLEATVAYVGVREQFGRPIGSFQAVKHACADMFVQTTIGRELLVAAVRAVADDQPDASVAVAMAKSYVCAAAVDVAGKAMQLHGGIGYTWESGIHVYFKRAMLGRSLFGSPAAQRSRLARRYG